MPVSASPTCDNTGPDVAPLCSLCCVSCGYDCSQLVYNAMSCAGVARDVLQRQEVTIENLGVRCPECGTNPVAGISRRDIDQQPIIWHAVLVPAFWPLGAAVLMQMTVAATAGREYVDDATATAVFVSIINAVTLLFSLSSQRVVFTQNDRARDGSRAPGMMFGGVCAGLCTTLILLLANIILLY
jgi:hypothetical protein